MGRGKKYVAKSVLYGILTFVCIIFIKSMWTFAIIFAALTAFNIFMAVKHKNDRPHPLVETAMKKHLEQKQEKTDKKAMEKQRKAEYNARIEKIEKEFDDFDYGDE